MKSYIKYIIKSHWGFLIFALIFIPLVQFLLIDVFTGTDTKPFIDSVMKMMPPQFKMIVGEQFFSSLSVEGAAAFGFNHPIVLTIFIILIINLTSTHLAGEIERGTMEIMLSFPVRRISIIITLWLIAMIILFLIVLFAYMGQLFAVYIFDTLTGEFAFKIIKIALNLWLFMTMIMSFSIMISSFMKEANKSASITAIAMLVFYFADILSSMWKPLDFLKPFNIFTYYQPQKLLIGQRTLTENLPLLIGLTIIFFVISLWQFRRRDI